MSPFLVNENELTEDIKLQFDSSVRFSDFPLHYDIVDSLTCNGYIFPSPVQYHLLSQDIDENLLVQAKSGTGKTIAFTVYIINKILFKLDDNETQTLNREEILVLFIAPTREICIQINDTVSTLTNNIKGKYSITGLCCLGGSPISEDIDKFRDKSRILLTSTPGRFIQLTKTNCIKPLIPDKIKSSLICLLLDEADRLFEGCFIRQTKYILNLCIYSQLIAFSATFPQEKLQMIKTTLKNVKLKYKSTKGIELRQIQLCASLRPNKIDDNSTIKVYDKVFEMSEKNKEQEDSILYISRIVGSPILKGVKFLLFDDILEYSMLRNYFDENDYFQWSCCINSIVKILFKVPFRQSVIFTNNSSLGYKITVALKSIGIPVMYTNGRRSQAEREKIFLALKRNVCRIVVSSDLFSRGVDVKRIDLVVNIDMPIDKETFLHRSGRTGRFGQTGVVVCIPTCKTEYDSFSYIFSQLGIQYQSFTEYCNEHDKKIIRSNNYEMIEQKYISNLHSFNKSNSFKEDSIDKCMDTKKVNFRPQVRNLNSKISSTEHILEGTSFLRIEEVDEIILNIWRKPLGGVVFE
ncbi:Dhh1-like SF II RNA helicase [Cryptosporidium bovis]|uniref:Dhh1-like SF II RNA helicase n=1 Tax=Cryptosporidium bovis TaxID=310047 RepID=UPI00351A7790|nr:Dhh1-like SF II RNA helicase [Cryptosporidium bovis]